MVLGSDTQYDLSWEEQDKIRRRLEIKARLKQENVMKRYNPFHHMKGEPFVDPAVERYMDYRKKGRMPNVPLAPRLFFSYFAMIVVPIGVITYLTELERQPYLAKCESGDLPYIERWGLTSSPIRMR